MIVRALLRPPAVSGRGALLGAAALRSWRRWAATGGGGGDGAVDLQRRVSRLAAQRDGAGAVSAVRDYVAGAGPRHDTAASARHFPWPALSSALFACLESDNAALGLELVGELRGRCPHLAWTDESTLSVLLRLQCAAGDRPAATQLFTYLVQQNMMKPRTASTFLRSVCASASASAPAQERREARDLAFAVYGECLRRGVELGAGDYTALGRLCVLAGEPLGTLHHLLANMQSHVAEVPEAFVRDVVEAWCGGAGGGATARRVVITHEIAAAAEAGGGAGPSGVQLRSSPCPHCHRRLHGYPFLAADRDRLLADIADTVVPAKCRSRRAHLGFEAWRRYVQQRVAARDRIDVLVDGANVGYYGLSSWYSTAKRAQLLRRGVAEADITADLVDFGRCCRKGAGGKSGVDVGVNFALVHLALEECVAAGLRRPLVILHERHLEPRNMAGEDAEYARLWRERGWVYCTPSGLNDDLCWLHAALALTTPTDSGGSSAGEGAPPTYVLTNDLMRDHLFSLLSPRSFSRWRESHQIRFRCSYRKNERTELSLVWPAPFSRCLQAIDHDARLGWHVPYRVGEEGEEGEEGDAEGEEEHVADSALEQQQDTSWVCMRFSQQH